MKELPNPTFPLSQIGLRAALCARARRRRHRRRRQRGAQGPRCRQAPAVVVPGPRHRGQAGHHRRLGPSPRRCARRPSACAMKCSSAKWAPASPRSLAGHDMDLFDDFCEHLLVRDELTQPGDRHLPRADAGPGAPRRAALSQRHRIRPDPPARPARAHGRAGRSCVHPEHRQGGVILALWGALAGFMHAQQARHDDRLRQHPDVGTTA